MSYRTAQLDPDNRRDPKTDCFCIRCSKDLKPGQPRRWVHIMGGGALVLHPEDEVAFAADIAAQRGDMGWFTVGMDCARKIGLEFTILNSVSGALEAAS